MIVFIFTGFIIITIIIFGIARGCIRFIGHFHIAVASGYKRILIKGESYKIILDSPLIKHCNLFYKFLVSIVNATPVQIIDKIINIPRTTGSIFVIICVFEHITRNERDSSPNSSVLMFIYKNV